MNIFDLTKKQGQFETTPEKTLGIRKFGLWSYTKPKEGDLIVIQREQGKALYVIIDEPVKDFTGSNDESFWRGTMKDVIHFQIFTPEMESALRSRGLITGEVRYPAPAASC